MAVLDLSKVAYLVSIEVQSGLVSGVAPQAQLSGSSWPSGALS